jgi:plasmid stabilization system protein ParE
MTYKIKYLPSFSRDINNIAAALSAYTSKTKRLLKEMDKKLLLLEDNPFMCPAFHAYPKYRKMVLEDHLLFYTVNEKEHVVNVHHILYARMDIERRLKD